MTARTRTEKGFDSRNGHIAQQKDETKVESCCKLSFEDDVRQESRGKIVGQSRGDIFQTFFSGRMPSFVLLCGCARGVKNGGRKEKDG